MKRMIVALSLVAIATFAFAGEPPCGGPHGLAGPGMEHSEHAQAEIATALGLSADQKAQWDSIHQQLAASIMPLKMQMGPAEQQLQSLVESSNPDATAIGRQFLAIRAIQQQIKAAHDATVQKIDAILTPDQKAKLDSLHERMEGGQMMKMRRPEPGFRE